MFDQMLLNTRVQSFSINYIFHVILLFFSLQIPHIETRWDYRLRRESCLVNLYPHPSTLSRVSFFHFSFLNKQNWFIFIGF